MADSIGGFPTSGLERFVGGFQSGYEKMTDMRKKSDDLKTQLAVNAKNRETAASAPKSGGGSDSSTTREGAYDTGGTTGSGGGSGGSGGSDGSVSSFDPAQTGTGHVAPKSERIEYYNQLAKEYGLNAQAMLMTADKEGLHTYVGDNGKSFGDFQMYTGGGMGNEALAAGINIRDPNTWKEQGRFAAQQMAAHKGDAKWFAGQWHGPANYAPWAVRNFSNPDAVPPGGRAQAPAAAPAQPSAEPAASAAAPAAAPAPTAPPAALSLAPMPNTSLGSSGIAPPPRMTGRPQQMSGLGGPPPQQQAAIGGPGGQPQQPPPDLYSRPQAPPPPSVLAQLVGQQYLPQQNASLSPQQDAGWMNSFSQSPRQAPDGNHYLPDPSRPGKYLMVG